MDPAIVAFWIEQAGVFTALACVALTVRQNIWSWPIGLVSVILFLWIFWSVKLYSDVILQAIYIPMQIYGWMFWLHGGKGRARAPVVCMPWRERRLYAFIGVAGTWCLGWIMATKTDAALPFPDAAIAVFSLVAQWLMGRKRLESWLVWITVDAIAVGVYSMKDLRSTSVLYAVFLCMATMGFVEWRRDWRSQQEAAA